MIKIISRVFAQYQVVGFSRTVFLIYRKIISYTYRILYFPECESLMFLSNPQIVGSKFINIQSLTSGINFRLEALKLNGVEKSPCIKIGKNVSFGHNAHVASIECIVIGSNVLAGSNVYITDHEHGAYGVEELCHSSPYSAPAFRVLISKPVVIGSNVHIGENVAILKGVTIGDGVIIGAGSVVTHSVVKNTIVGGVPAKPIKKYNDKSKRWESISSIFE